MYDWPNLMFTGLSLFCSVARSLEIFVFIFAIYDSIRFDPIRFVECVCVSLCGSTIIFLNRAHNSIELLFFSTLYLIVFLLLFFSSSSSLFHRLLKLNNVIQSDYYRVSFQFVAAWFGFIY